MNAVVLPANLSKLKKQLKARGSLAESRDLSAARSNMNEGNEQRQSAKPVASDRGKLSTTTS
jgi:hypothetical protein